jgi:lipopolysaccharide biosynthesis regulator YciM
MLAIIERKHEDARREFEHCLAIKPDHAYAHMALSGLSGDDRTEVKATHLKEVLKVQPNNARAQKEMAEIHLRAGEFEDAARLLKAVIENEPYLEDGCGIMNEYVNGVLTGALSSFVKDEARELLSRLPPL